MVEHHVEQPGVDVPDQLVHRPAGNPEMLHQALLPEREHAFQRPLRAGDPIERVALRVVQVEQAQPVDPESLAALLERPAHPRGRELLAPVDGIRLGRDHRVRRQAAQASELPDQAFARASAVLVRRVDEPDAAGQRPLEDLHRPDRPPECARAEADRGDLQAGAAQHPPFHRRLLSRTVCEPAVRATGQGYGIRFIGDFLFKTD